MKKVLLYLTILVFAIVGIYLTFIDGNVNKYDSKTEAYRIDPNESIDSDGNVMYQPIYHFRVDRNEYECMADGSSSFAPKENKNMVYYDSSNPEKCITEYGKSTSRIGGIIFLILDAIAVYAFIIKKPSDTYLENNQIAETDIEEQYQSDENAEKVLGVIGRVQLIYKRIILGIIIIVLLVFILIDTVIVRQTIKARDYIDATAVFVSRNNTIDSSFDDCTYAFTDKQGVHQEIIVSIPKEDEQPKAEIKIKYDENNPQEYYEEGATMDKKGFWWYIGKIVVMVLLILLFFNKKLLSKIGISIG